MQMKIANPKFDGLSKRPIFQTTLTLQKKPLAFLMLALLIASPATQAVSVGMSEHQDVLDLVPTKAVNREVIKSGAWSNPATWSGGQLPIAGQNIYVPADKSLLVDVASDVSLNTLRADGILEFASTKNVKIKLDTLVVTATGTFKIGSETNPVPSTNRVEIIIAQNGQIDRKWDPSNVSRGVILQGKTQIFGAQKSAFHALSVKPDIGSTQIQLASLPTGWAVGDMVVVTAGQYHAKIYYENSFVTEDEVRRIKSISGTTITLGSVNDSNVSAPLAYNHISAIANMPVYAANLTRNVVFSSEGGSSVPASQRGHFMVMHTPNVVVKGAGFYYFGRTDKSKPVDDFKLYGAQGRRVITNGQFIADLNNNPRGRYAVHFHHTGVSNITIPPVICSGNAVFSSPGWGFVNHTGNVIMENNASYDVFGSHYVAEDGNELGSFKHNIAIRAQGSNRPFPMGEFNHDVGHSGNGFWLESRNLSVEDNVVSGVKNAGLVYFQRNPITPPADLQIAKESLLTPNKEIVKNMPSIFYADIPITDDKNNTVVSSGLALKVVKGGRNQGHDVRNMFESLKGYSNKAGLELSYTEKYTLRDLHLIANPKAKRGHIGVSIAKRTTDIVLVNAEINGYLHPVVTGTSVKGQPDETEAVFVNVTVDGSPINLATDIHKPNLSFQSNYNPGIHHALNLSDTVNSSVLKFTPNADAPTALSGAYTFAVRGTKSDSLGNVAFKSDWDKPSLEAIKRNGYFIRPDGKKAIVITDIYTDRLNGQTRKYDTLINFTPGYHAIGSSLGQLAN